MPSDAYGMSAVPPPELFTLPRVQPPKQVEEQLKLEAEYRRLKGKVEELQKPKVDEPTALMAEDILAWFTGLDTSTEHGKDTPTRFLNMLDELTACRNCGGQCIKWKKFKAETDEMIIVKKIPFVSVCNHHIIPFVGEARIGYVPDEWEAGLSKFGRMVQHYARKLQTQERLTDLITEALQSSLQPKGVIVQLEAEHMCMTVRGVQMPGATTVTTKTLGVFADHTKTAKMEFLEGIK
jgi:GTP cyclohydrolase I